MNKKDSKKKPLVQLDMFEEMYSSDRDLLPQEYAALREKQSKGYMDATFFRKNIFNASSRGKRTEYVKPKLVWTRQDGKGELVYVSHSLHQKHADVLSLIYSEGFRQSKPSSSGNYLIFISLYGIAKMMGYSSPASGADKVKKFINDLRWTDFIIKGKDGTTLRTTILDDAWYSDKHESYAIEIKGRNAKILAHTTGIKFEKRINREIVSIPDSLSKLKAMIRFIISNTPTKHGYSLELFFEKFGVGQSGKETSRKNQKSLFKRNLAENKDWLDRFNIRWDGEQEKIYYEEVVEGIDFLLPMSRKDVLILIDKQNSPYKEHVGKTLKINDVLFELMDVIQEEGLSFVLTLKTIYSGEIGRVRIASLNRIEELLAS